jgi:hypothetical protein
LLGYGLGVEYIALNEEDFTRLVNGEAVDKPGCRIILSDIGFPVMEQIIAKARLKQVVKRATAETEKLL